MGLLPDSAALDKFLLKTKKGTKKIYNSVGSHIRIRGIFLPFFSFLDKMFVLPSLHISLTLSPVEKNVYHDGFLIYIYDYTSSHMHIYAYMLSQKNVFISLSFPTDRSPQSLP